MRKLKYYQELLVPFDEIMKKSLKGKLYHEFVRLRSAEDFCDGFVINQGHCSGAKGLQSFLKSNLLECLLPRPTAKTGYYFAKQQQGPFTIDFPLDSLEKVVVGMNNALKERQ